MAKDVEPLVTIMMPTFNRAEFISDSIKSLLNQTYRNWELIILNDGSTDGTKRVVSEFLSDIRIVYIENKKNIGISKCRNIALGMANGDFIGHLDDDDMLHPEAIGNLMKEFRKNENLELVYSDYIKTDVYGNFISMQPGPDFSIENLPKLGFRHFCMYRKHAATSVGGFNEKLPHCSDGDLFMKLAIRGRCKRVPEYLYLYRSHTTNIGHRRPKCNVCNFSGVCNYYIIWKRICETLKSEKDGKKCYNNRALRVE